MRRDNNPEKNKKVLRVMGQKVFIATSRGVDLLHQRLLCGPVDYFDTCMHELTYAGKAMRSEFPLAGSREHYSLVNGGIIIEEEIPERPKQTDASGLPRQASPPHREHESSHSHQVVT